MNNYDLEVKQRFGETEAYKEYNQKTAIYTKEKMQGINDGLMDIFAKFSLCLKNGNTDDSNEAHTLVKELQNHITENYYTCTNQILAGLGQIYVADERFKTNINKKGNGTAEFVSKAGKYSWLTGLLKCATCGYSIKINNFKKENKLKLICSGRSNLKICDETFNCDIKEIEQLFADAINQTLIDNPPDTANESNKKQLEEIVEIDKKLERLISSIEEADNISMPYINKRIKELTERKNELIAASRKEKPVAKPIDFDKLTFDEKRLVAHEFINKILLSNDKIDIDWK